MDIVKEKKLTTKDIEVKCPECRSDPKVKQTIQEIIEKFYKGVFDGSFHGDISPKTQLITIINFFLRCKHRIFS